MSANLFGDRFAGRTPAWHKMGTVNPEGWATAVEAFDTAGLNYEIHKLPMVAQLETPMGTQLIPSDRFGIYREPVADDNEWRFLGAVSEQYEPIQNITIAHLMDLTGLTEQWPVETVGALGMGEHTFTTLYLGDQEVGGVESETVMKFFAIHDTKNGSGGLKAFFTPIRIVCANTLTLATRQATALSWYRHGTDLAVNLEYKMKMLKKLTEIEQESMIDLDRMAEAVLDEKQENMILENAYPLPARPRKAQVLDQDFTSKEAQEFSALIADASNALVTWESQCDTIMSLRNEVREVYGRFNDEQPEVARSPWALYNAVAEFEDHLRKQRADTNPAVAVFGWKAKIKSRAYEMALAVTKK